MAGSLLPCLSGAPPSGVRQTEKNKYLLPAGVVPVEYDLLFEPNFNDFSFSGSESVKVRVLQPVAEIVLNAIELEISSAKLQALVTSAREGMPAAMPPLQNLQVVYEPATEKVRFVAKESVKPGIYELHCKFSGKLNSQLRGFYRTSYEDDAHKRHWLAATQMEPTDARRMFPCFDEPAYKAVFRIKATVSKGLVAISNAPQLREESLDARRKMVVFAPTPRMSTYLTALVVGEFKWSGLSFSGRIPIRVWAPAGKEALGEFAQGHAARIMDYLTAYFGMPYFGKKLDLIALPELGMFDAMENVGAITFHDTDLLVDRSTSASKRLSVVIGMIHEMSHQWFGDLVTMKWWDDLWLNESFATWMTTKVLIDLYPNSEASTSSIYLRYGSMSTDSLKATRAIHAAVTNPSQAVEMFDGITYQKGAAVLRMLESFVGEKAFQRGIRKYLHRYALQNACAEDLWNAIAAESGAAPVAEIMRSFVFQPGYPQLNVRFAGGGSGIVVSQYRQLQSGQDRADPLVWTVPVAMRVLSLPGTSRTAAAGGTFRLLKGRQQQFKVDSRLPVLINAGACGYYQTCYAPDYLKKLQASFAQLSTEEKIVLLSDCNTLVLPGDVPVEDFYNFVYLINSERDSLIKADLVFLLSGPDPFVSDRLRPDYQRWVCRLLLPLKTKLSGWHQKGGEPQAEKELRVAVLNVLGTSAQDRRTVEEALAMFRNYLKDRNAVDPDQLPLILQIVTANGGRAEYEELLKLYRSSNNPVEKERALHALPQFRDGALASKTLALGLSSEVKAKEGIAIINEVAFNRYTREIGWAFIKEHWQEILRRFPPESLRGLAEVGGTFDTPEKEADVRAWYATHPVPYGKARTARMLESLHAKVLYRQRYAARICQWVAAQALKLPKKVGSASWSRRITDCG
jgi:puromycin-sensitive aminopeptidase